ncbi:hypothetical protein HK102_003224 [Quaeritorhiza haematococci]|nr:hypothetical protein HK102_003224 [Quaeritorhiza haematococci]
MLLLQSPWTQYFKDTELQKIIKQDVERTFPDQTYFREPYVQSAMTAILFIWCKVNPDVSYRQVLDPNYVEHDAFVLFSRVMRSAKVWYEVPEDGARRPSLSSMSLTDGRPTMPDLHHDHIDSVARDKLPAIVRVSHKIQSDFLRTFDFELYQHLEDHHIEPQLYGIRWLRLLFGREFSLPDILKLWDGIFATNVNLDLAEWICAAMLMSIRHQLIGQDYTGTLRHLMKFPRPEDSKMSISHLLATAIQLRHQYLERGHFLPTNEKTSLPLSNLSTEKHAAEDEHHQKHEVLHQSRGGRAARKPVIRNTVVPWVRDDGLSGGNAKQPASPSQNERDTEQMPDGSRSRSSFLEKQVRDLQTRHNLACERLEGCVKIVEELVVLQCGDAESAQRDDQGDQSRKGSGRWEDRPFDGFADMPDLSSVRRMPQSVHPPSASSAQQTMRGEPHTPVNTVDSQIGIDQVDGGLPSRMDVSALLLPLLKNLNDVLHTLRRDQHGAFEPLAASSPNSSTTTFPISTPVPASPDSFVPNEHIYTTNTPAELAPSFTFGSQEGVDDGERAESWVNKSKIIQSRDGIPRLLQHRATSMSSLTSMASSLTSTLFGGAVGEQLRNLNEMSGDSSERPKSSQMIVNNNGTRQSDGAGGDIVGSVKAGLKKVFQDFFEDTSTGWNRTNIVSGDPPRVGVRAGGNQKDWRAPSEITIERNPLQPPDGQSPLRSSHSSPSSASPTLEVDRRTLKGNSVDASGLTRAPVVHSFQDKPVLDPLAGVPVGSTSLRRSG